MYTAQYGEEVCQAFSLIQILFLIFGGKVRYNVPDVFTLSGVLFGLIVANKIIDIIKRTESCTYIIVWYICYIKIRIEYEDIRMLTVDYRMDNNKYIFIFKS